MRAAKVLHPTGHSIWSCRYSGEYAVPLREIDRKACREPEADSHEWLSPCCRRCNCGPSQISPRSDREGRLPTVARAASLHPLAGARSSQAGSAGTGGRVRQGDGFVSFRFRRWSRQLSGHPCQFSSQRTHSSTRETPRFCPLPLPFLQQTYSSTPKKSLSRINCGSFGKGSKLVRRRIHPDNTRSLGSDIAVTVWQCG